MTAKEKDGRSNVTDLMAALQASIDQMKPILDQTTATAKTKKKRAVTKKLKKEA